ncbi:MAG: MATE family efflux transporter [Spirochaetales bacterium]|nr:MATE family efflux transporter [Spirochaetales bacterium]
MSDIKTREIKGMFDGPILPVTLRLGIPILIGQVFGFLYNLVDTYFIAQIDRTSTALISGTAIIFPLFFLFLSLGNGLIIGVSTLVARGIGEKNQKALNGSSSSALFIAVIITIISLLFGYIFLKKIIFSLAGDELSDEAIEYGIQYFSYILPGLGILLIGYVFIGILQGEGLTKHIAIAMSLSTGLNIILDPVFIFVLKMGVAGAAFATTVSIAITALYVIFIFLTNQSSIPFNLNIFKAKKELVAEIVRIGAPQALSMISLSLAFIVLNNLVSSIGEAEMNSWGICGRLDQMVLIPAFSISGAHTTMIGQNYGRQIKDRLHTIYIKNTFFVMITALFLAVCYILLAPFILSLFSDVPAVIAGSVKQIRITALSFFGITIAIISAGTFQGIGKPVPALILPLIRFGVFTIPLSYIFIYFFHMHMEGIFYSVVIGNLAGAVISFFWTKNRLSNVTFRTIMAELS